MPVENTPTTPATTHRLPWWTLAVASLAAVVWFVPGTFNPLVYDRGLILHGQVWRVLTGHWVHFTGSHLFWNLAILLPAGIWLERLNVTALRRTFLLSPFAISLAVLALAPSLDRYGGISGVASAVLVALAINGLRTEPRARWFWLGVLVLFFAKLGFESFVHRPLNPDLASRGIASAPLAHLIGAAVGAFAVFSTRKSK